MKNKLIIAAVLFGLVALVSIFILADKKELSAPQKDEVVEIIFFYGDGCPHCALVEKYFDENRVEEKISFAKREVYYNKQNASELAEKAKTCGISTDSIGVPFLWDGSRCLVGDQDIIEFFKSKINE